MAYPPQKMISKDHRKGETKTMSETRAAYAAKQAIIDEIKGKLENAQSAVVIDYIGITVDEANQMRNKLRAADVDYTVYKNTLVKRAIEGTKFEELAQVLEGPSAVAISSTDATAPARVLDEVMTDLKKMAFKGGVVEDTYYDAEGMKQIAKIPGREALIAKFMGSIQSPISKAVRTFAAIADAKAEGKEMPAKEEAPAAEAPAEEAPAAEE
jgi:large subunit ribosomal protein L10